MSKLKWLHVVIIGIVLAIAIAAAGWFLLISPKTQLITDTQKKIDDCDKVIATKADQEKKLEEAKRDLLVVHRDLNEYLDKYANIRFEQAGGDYEAMFALWIEYRDRLGQSFNKFVQTVSNCQVKAVALPQPPNSPVPAPPNGFIRVPDSGTINLSVTGSFGEIIKLLRNLTKFNRLMAIGPNITISGMSPNLSATIPIAFYIIANEPEGVLAAAGGGGGGAAAGGAGPPGAGPPEAGPPGAGPPGVGPPGAGAAAPAEPGSSEGGSESGSGGLAHRGDSGGEE